MRDQSARKANIPHRVERIHTTNHETILICRSRSFPRNPSSTTRHFRHHLHAPQQHTLAYCAVGACTEMHPSLVVFHTGPIGVQSPSEVAMSVACMRPLAMWCGAYARSKKPHPHTYSTRRSQLILPFPFWTSGLGGAAIPGISLEAIHSAFLLRIFRSLRLCRLRNPSCVRLVFFLV